MKKISMLLWVLSAVIAIGLMSCDEHEKFSSLPESVQKAFNDKYPNARFDEWEMKHGYYVLDFRNAGTSAEAWFNSHQWVMTETDIRQDGLPVAVAQALQASKYATWRIDDIDFVERATMEPLYVIELEQGEAEVELTYLSDGTLIKEDLDLDDDAGYYLPELPVEILSKVDEMYPGAVVLEGEFEHNVYEVEILHQRVEKEVVFGRDFSWMYTSQDVRIADLPQVVLDLIHNQYEGYEIDDVELFVTASQGDFYEIELEKGMKEITIKVSVNGELIA